MGISVRAWCILHISCKIFQIKTTLRSVNILKMRLPFNKNHPRSKIFTIATCVWNKRAFEHCNPDFSGNARDMKLIFSVSHSLSTRHKKYHLSQLTRLWYFSSSRKFILQTRMRIHPVGVNVWFLVGPFIYFHTLCVRTAKALARLRGCAGSPDPSQVAYVISTIISWAG